MCVWGLVCSMSAIDQEKNNISLFNIIDHITIPRQVHEQSIAAGKLGVLVPIEHEVVLLWRRVIAPSLCDVELNTDMKLSLVDSGGGVLNEMLTPIKFESGKRNLRLRVKNNALKVTQAGDYVYRIEVLQPGSDTFTKALEIPLLVQIS